MKLTSTKYLSTVSLGLLISSISTLSYAHSATENQSQALEPVKVSKVNPIQLQFSKAEIDQMLAPIALYPDTVLSQILVAATYPVELIEANRWVIKHPNLDANEALSQVKDKDWDASVKALVPFPRILAKMSEDLKWTQNLGDAFLQNETAVLDRIQVLRTQAYDAGNLDDLKNLKVVKEKKNIVIESSEPQIVYVPYYDPSIVYGSWRWAAYPPFHWNYPYYQNAYYSPHSNFFWSPGIYLSFGYGFSFNWLSNQLVYVDNYYPYGYYNSHQIVRSHYARRWQHNPYHRRGAVYRSRAVTHRYNSNRPSRGERYSSRSTIVGRANSASGYDSVTRNIKNRQYNAVIRPNTRQRRIQSELTERSRVQSSLRENVQRDINRESGHSVSSQDRRNNSGNRHSSRNNRSNIVRGNNRTFTGSGAGRQRTQPIVIREPKIRQEVQSSPPPSRSSYRPPEPRRESRSSSRSYNASPRSFNSNRSSSSRGQRAFRGGNRSHGGGARQRH